MCTINHVKFGGDHTGIGRESGAAAHAPAATDVLCRWPVYDNMITGRTVAKTTGPEDPALLHGLRILAEPDWSNYND